MDEGREEVVGGLPTPDARPEAPAPELLLTLGRSFAALAHDAGNLLGLVRGRLGLALGRPGLPGEIEADLEAALEAASAASSLFRAALELAQGSARAPAPLALPAFLEARRPLLASLAGRSVRLQLEIDPETPKVRADEASLLQILWNLALNAVEAMPGGGRLWVRCGRVRRDGLAAARLEIEDEGPGIPPGLRAGVFTPGCTTRDTAEPRGLGLAIVAERAALLGAELRLLEGPAGGALFRLTLPAAS